MKPMLGDRSPVTMPNLENHQNMKLSTANRHHTLKLLSYNIQVGIGSHSYRDYVMQSWRHLLPDNQRHSNLSEIAHHIADYDIVALQEVDAGSIRTHFVNQVAFLAKQGGFPHWHHQQNRHIGRFAAHSNGLLAKYPLDDVVLHRLPGAIAGRGALQVSFTLGECELLILSVHLALSPKARRKQLAYICKLLGNFPYFVLMGDMNCNQSTTKAEMQRNGLKVNELHQIHPTFPRWKPKYQLDQIWVSSNLNIINSQVIDIGVSDHLPIAMEVEIPELVASRQQTARHLIN